MLLLRKTFAMTHQGANSGRSGVKMSEFVFFDKLPPPSRIRTIHGSFIEKTCGSVTKRPVNDVAVSAPPSRIRGAPPNVFWLKIENEFERGVNADHVTAVN